MEEWKLTDLYGAEPGRGPEADLARAREAARAFEQRYLGRLASLGAEELAAAVDEWEAVETLCARAVSFAELQLAADMTSAEHLTRLERARGEAGSIRASLLGFELEWLALSAPVAEQFLRAPALRGRASLLRRLRRYAPHRLSLPEERILERTAHGGARAFSRLRDHVMAHARFNLEELASGLQAHSPQVRHAAAEALTRGLREQEEVLLFAFNALLQDKALRDELRGYRQPEDEQHLSNEVAASTVQLMLEAGERHSGLVQRFYRLKARRLGVDRLQHFDRLAPVVASGRGYSYEEAQRLVVEAYGALAPPLGDIAALHFQGRWVDAQPRPGKRDGAFALATVPDAHPYVLLSYTGGLGDVLTLAHEVGHGIHLYLAQRRGLFAQAIPVILAETASVLGEALVLERLVEQEREPRPRLGLLLERLERCMNNVFRQVALTRFEQQVHTAFRREGALSPGHVSRLWLQVHRAMYGDSLHLGEGYAVWWLAIPHFWHAPFYCYAYALGELLALGLLRRRGEEGFASRYVELLAAGGSEEPSALLAGLGFELGSSAFWEGALEVIEDMVEQAERLSASL